MERGPLLVAEESSRGSSLRALTHEALSNPRVREMLETFRSDGPAGLAAYVNDPECEAALAALRGPATELRPRVLVCVTGSVAAVKVPELVASLGRIAEVRVAATERGQWFVERGRESGYHSARIEMAVDEYSEWRMVGDRVLHVDLAKWANAMVVAPASANAIAKMANGLCDDLVSCVARAWDYRKPLLIAPAMNTQMWHHPATEQHLATLRSWGARLVPPVAKTLACGDTGLGALADVDDIVHDVLESLEQHIGAA